MQKLFRLVKPYSNKFPFAVGTSNSPYTGKQSEAARNINLIGSTKPLQTVVWKLKWQRSAVDCLKIKFWSGNLDNFILFGTNWTFNSTCQSNN